MNPVRSNLEVWCNQLNRSYYNYHRWVCLKIESLGLSEDRVPLWFRKSLFPNCARNCRKSPHVWTRICLALWRLRRCPRGPCQGRHGSPGTRLPASKTHRKLTTNCYSTWIGIYIYTVHITYIYIQYILHIHIYIYISIPIDK
jgi:hypothetical protein